MKKVKLSRRLLAVGEDQRGATAVEYGLILALIFLALVVGVSSLGSSLKERWEDIANQVKVSGATA